MNKEEYIPLTKEERYKQHQDLITMFPETFINQTTHTFIKKRKKWKLYRPFDLETGKLTYGDYNSIFYPIN